MVKLNSSSGFPGDILEVPQGLLRAHGAQFGDHFVDTPCRNECDGAQAAKTTAWLHDGLCFLLLSKEYGGLNLPAVRIKCCSLQERGYHRNVCSHIESMKQAPQGGTVLGLKML